MYTFSLFLCTLQICKGSVSDRRTDRQTLLKDASRIKNIMRIEKKTENIMIQNRQIDHCFQMGFPPVRLSVTPREDLLSNDAPENSKTSKTNPNRGMDI